MSGYLDYRIAGLHVRMDTFGRTLTQARPYAAPIDGEADILIRSDAARFQVGQPHLSFDSCEYMSTGVSFYRQLLRFNGLLLHSSCVVMDGYAYAFTAHCGTGKSTHTALWLQAFGTDRAYILNDDKPALRFENGVWYAYGTPWSGKTNLNCNRRVPLGGVCVLARGDENRVEPFGGSKVIFALLEQTVRPATREGVSRLLDLLGCLLCEVPLWHMQCTPTVEAAHLAHAVMSREAEARFGIPSAD